MNGRRPVAIVTGGTHGIGRHVAQLLAGDGWSIALCSRDGDGSARVAFELEATHAVATLGAAADVRSAADLQAFADDVVRRLGTPWAVIANAAVPGPIGPLHAVDLSAWADAISVDLVGVANTLATFGAVMAREGGGRLVTMSGGGVGGPQMSNAMTAYTCSKAAVVALTESVAEELRPFGVAVNAVAPGAVATRFMDPVIAAGPSIVGERLYEVTVRQRQQPDSLDSLDRLLRLLLDPEAPLITGRLLSARWDDPEVLRATPPAALIPLYRLRRIDGASFSPVTED